MAAELADKFGCAPRLIEGGRGIFEVKVDGAVVFSKRQVGRFPNPGELSGIVEHP